MVLMLRNTGFARLPSAKLQDRTIDSANYSLLLATLLGPRAAAHLVLQVLDDGLNIDAVLGGSGAHGEALGGLGHLQCTSTLGHNSGGMRRDRGQNRAQSRLNWAEIATHQSLLGDGGGHEAAGSGGALDGQGTAGQDDLGEHSLGSHCV